MPAWLIHDKYASKLGISKALSREINIEIDSIDDMRYHDYGRFISSGRWDFVYLLPAFERSFKRWRRREAVEAFFLHHILDYIGTLLGTPSVQMHAATKLVKKLIDDIKEDFSASDVEGKEMALNSCDEIYHLLRENLKEIITDIKPPYREEVLWAERRIMEVYCEKCDRPFPLIDREGRVFLSRNFLIGITERSIRLCPECRGYTTYAWIEAEFHSHKADSPSARYRVLCDEFYFKTGRKYDSLLLKIKEAEVQWAL